MRRYISVIVFLAVIALLVHVVYAAQFHGTFQLGLTTPSAPTVTPQGTTGSTTYTYFVVAKDPNGKRTVASSSGQTTTGNASLNGTNFNRITWTAITGAASYDVLKTNTSTLLGSVTGTQLDDTGQATSAYTVAAANESSTQQLSFWLANFNGYTGPVSLDEIAICNPVAADLYVGQSNVTSSNGFVVKQNECLRQQAADRPIDANGIYLKTTVAQSVAISLRSR